MGFQRSDRRSILATGYKARSSILPVFCFIRFEITLIPEVNAARSALIQGFLRPLLEFKYLCCKSKSVLVEAVEGPKPKGRRKGGCMRFGVSGQRGLLSRQMFSIGSALPAAEACDPNLQDFD